MDVMGGEKLNDIFLKPEICLSGTELLGDESCAPLADACVAVGATGVELWYPDNTKHDGLEQTVRIFAAEGISVVALSAGIELYRDHGADEQQRKLLELVSKAGELGIRRVNTYFGFADRLDDEKAIEGYLRLVEPALTRACKKDVTILIENEFDAFGWDPVGSDITRRPHSLLALLDAAGSEHLKTTFDPANYLCAGVRPIDALNILKRHIAYVHVKDVVRIAGSSALAGWKSYSDHGRFYSTCPLGEGEVGWQSLFAELTGGVRYGGPFCLEPHSSRLNRETAWTYAAEVLASYSGSKSP